MDFFKIFTTYRELLIELVKREVKARYKQSILGYAWVILVPLLNLTVLTIVFSFFIRIPTGGVPYQVFLFAALVPWTFTSSSIALGTGSLIANSSLITKIKLPREIFPISAIVSKLIDFLLTLLILFIILLLFNTPITYNILYLPLIFLIHLIFIISVVFMLSAINVFYRDIENILGVLLTIWMYITPVLYPTELIPEYLVPLFNINPMMPIINSYRNILVYGTAPAWQSFGYAAVISLLMFIIGYGFFKRKSRFFADVI